MYSFVSSQLIINYKHYVLLHIIAIEVVCTYKDFILFDILNFRNILPKKCTHILLA